MIYVIIIRGNCLKHRKRGWNRKEGRRHKDFKKGGQAGSSGGCLKKEGECGLEPPYKLCVITLASSYILSCSPWTSYALLSKLSLWDTITEMLTERFSVVMILTTSTIALTIFSRVVSRFYCLYLHALYCGLDYSYTWFHVFLHTFDF